MEQRHIQKQQQQLRHHAIPKSIQREIVVLYCIRVQQYEIVLLFGRCVVWYGFFHRRFFCLLLNEFSHLLVIMWSAVFHVCVHICVYSTANEISI